VTRRPATPTATYRLQLTPQFGFADAAGVVDYLATLGVSHLYLSPVLQAAPGSLHGYDVIDHGRINEELGGEDGLRHLADVAHQHGLGLVVDVVPNHMAVPEPESLNAALWSVLRDGPSSPFARWFDVDWSSQQRSFLMPVLGRRIGQCLESGELTLDTDGHEPVLRYYDHEFPVREGTESLALPELVDRQWYRLAHWRVGDEELNYRRFFDVGTLVAVRVEDPDVFDATHRLLLTLHADGVVDGFRIDHPDGLADPREYVRRLAAAAPGAWVVVEKILEGDERLPDDWPCAGTTGYDALMRVTGVAVDPSGGEALSTLWSETAPDELREFETVAQTSKQQVVATSLRAEIARLVDLAHLVSSEDLTYRDLTRANLEAALVAMLVAFPVYRAYVVPGEDPPDTSVQTVTDVADTCAAQHPHLSDELAYLRELALGRLGSRETGKRAEFAVRFQQTCGPVMAKGVEDTTFYRWHRLAALNEVGGRPEQFAVFPDELHDWAGRQQDERPFSMTTLSTHDTKRSEDVRARMLALSEVPDAWRESVTGWRDAAGAYRSAGGWPDPVTEYLLWQTVVGTWPISAERLTAYVTKAAREAKLHTTWTDPDVEYESALAAFATGVVGDPAIVASVGAFVEQIRPWARVATLATKLVQLMLPGVPDVYQGCEMVSLSLVDPDNRRPVDFPDRRRRLAALDESGEPSDLDDEKLHVVATALRLRRNHPDWFAASGTYAPLPTTTTHALGFVRAGRVATLVTRRARDLESRGGWGDAQVVLPGGRWRSALDGHETDGGTVPAADLFGGRPVALLVRDDA
jgi:(1->4)-alpha-D-glucan 1-alpha-D-glucosylmutase